MKIRYLQFPAELLDILTHSFSAPKIQSIHSAKKTSAKSLSLLYEVWNGRQSKALHSKVGNGSFRLLAQGRGIKPHLPCKDRVL